MAAHGAGPISWADITVPPPPDAPKWDFTPFLSAPAVQSKSRTAGQVNLLNIPRTNIASPLARNLTASEIKNIRDTLVGPGAREDSAGMEQWLSWKRAWDVWNNNFVEGRANPLWLRREYERRVEAEKGKGKGKGVGRNWDLAREERRKKRQEERAAAAGTGQQAPTGPVLLPPDQIPQPVPGPHGGISTVYPTVGPHAKARPRTGAGKNVWKGGDMEMRDIFTADNVDDVDLDSDSESEAAAAGPNPASADGSSGGWKAMKDLPDYYEPGEDEDDGSVFVDKLVNTVWRPRRVGETTPKILTDDDVAEFNKNQELKVDGGVDCGRSPFPVLRPITVHVRTKDGTYRKKKSWDHVTGTLFNMPTQPLEPAATKPDPKIQQTQAMYQDKLRDHPQGKIFPLDIRRVVKVAPGIEAPRDFCEAGEQLVRDPNLYPQKTYRAMNKYDPWWVTDDQKLLRDSPPRGQPLQEERTSGVFLPLEDQLWEEERLRDLDMNAGYFITNLDGGKLIINGMEVRKGDVAGPLPALQSLRLLASRSRSGSAMAGGIMEMQTRCLDLQRNGKHCARRKARKI